MKSIISLFFAAFILTVFFTILINVFTNPEIQNKKIESAIFFDELDQKIELSNHEQSEYDTKARKIYDNLLSSLDNGDVFLIKDNVNGGIVWSESYFIESLLDMYEATHDTKYLDLFCKHADNILSLRDDNARLVDFCGNSRPGWQTGGNYTLGVPLIIPDENGYPSIEIQGIHSSGNNYTTIKIFREIPEHFSIKVENFYRTEIPNTVCFSNLTLDSAEHVVNANLSQKKWIKLSIVGDSLPIEGEFKLTDTYRMVLHELHTPIIGIPFLKFSYIAFREDLPSWYKSKARKYVHAFEESAKDYSSSFIFDNDGGYFIFEPDTPFHASGFEVPINGQSANGRFFLWLWKVTGKNEYLEISSAIARKIYSQITFNNDGTIIMPYYFKNSFLYDGYNKKTNPLIKSIYDEYAPYRSIEDVSHFGLTLMFMVDAYENGEVFSENDLKAVASTYSKYIWNPITHNECICDGNMSKGYFIAKFLNGKDKGYDYAISNFVLLSRWNSSIWDQGWQVYKTRFSNSRCSDKLSHYGVVMQGWSQLAKELGNDV